jgi:hypothetical protein
MFQALIIACSLNTPCDRQHHDMSFTRSEQRFATKDDCQQSADAFKMAHQPDGFQGIILCVATTDD